MEQKNPEKEINKVKLKICGNEFIVSADEDTDYIKATANRVDLNVNKLLKENDKFTINMATIVAALNYLDELQKEKEITNLLRSGAEKNEAIARKAVAENIALKEENRKLLEEKLGLHKRIQELQGNIKEKQPETEVKEEEKPKKEAVQSPLKAWAKAQQAPAADSKKGSSKAMGKSTPVKIDYQGNDQIDDTFRRDDFIDRISDDEMMSFFDDKA